MSEYVYVLMTYDRDGSCFNCTVFDCEEDCKETVKFLKEVYENGSKSLVVEYCKKPILHPENKKKQA